MRLITGKPFSPSLLEEWIASKIGATRGLHHGRKAKDAAERAELLKRECSYSASHRADKQD